MGSNSGDRLIILNDRDLTTDPFTSEKEILAAEEAGEVGEVMLVDTEFVFPVQVLPSLKQ